MKINTSFVEKILTKFIREELGKFNYSRGILGISGGLDSSVCAFLAARALQPENVIGLIMPYGEASKGDVEDAELVIEQTGIKSFTIDISPMVDSYYSQYPTDSKILKGNKMARERMSILYDFSEREKALILGTSNKTELLLGYGTIHGDMACAINPLGDLYKTQVRQMSEYLGLPEKIRKKLPSAGLWAGQTDEQELGLSYDLIDNILFLLVDERKAPEEIISIGFSEIDVYRVISFIKCSEFKRKMPPIAKLSKRTVGLDFLYSYDRDK